MKTVLKIAWRNCWRGKSRTIIVISSIVVGIWASLLFMGFMDGLMNQRVDGAVNTTWSHLQIASKTFEFDQDINNVVPNFEEVNAILDADTGVVAYSDRFVTEALIQTARKQHGGKIIGVNQEDEAQVVILHEKLVEGEYFGDQYKRPILIGKKMADELKVKLGSKIIVTFTNTDSIQASENYRVSGIYQSGNTGYDEYNVFVPKETMYKITGKPMVHQYLVKTTNIDSVDTYRDEIQAQVDDQILVNTWADSDPVLAMGGSVYDSVLLVIMIIIIIGLLFGIINTIVMSILERKREIGVLLAIGMNRNIIRMMIASESMYYGLIGGPIGVFLGYISILYFGKYGLDLSSYASGMMEYGLDPIIYFSLEPSYYFVYGGLVTLSAFIGGLYPARIATNLNPIEAISSV